jgi:hypothetical protein
MNHKLAWLPSIVIVEFFEALLKLVIATLNEISLVLQPTVGQHCAVFPSDFLEC